MIKILVVDDQQYEHVLLSRKLGVLDGVSVSGITEAIQAAQPIRDHEVDLIISDIRMPMMDGYKLLEWVRSRAPHIPVILMSGYYSEVAANESVARGAFGYVAKQKFESDLMPMVEKALAAIRTRNACDDETPSDRDEN